MPKRGENIGKRRDGRWEARFRNGLDSNGAPIYTSVYGKTYKEAKEKKHLALSATKIKPNNTAISFGDVQRMWATQNGVHLKASTERKYNYLLQSHILPEFVCDRLLMSFIPMVNAPPCYDFWCSWQTAPPS